MKKVTLLMLTVMMSVFAFAQEIQQIPQPGLKKKLTLTQQVLNAKREGKQLNKETLAQFNVRKPATSQLAQMKKQHNLNLPVHQMGEQVQYSAKFAPFKNAAQQAPRRSGEGYPKTYEFEDGLGDWTTIDADGDGYTWNSSTTASVVGHTNGGCVYSESYSTSGGALNPDNYLVSPKVKLGGSITFWACAQDASYAAEHFGVAVSVAGNTDAADFTTIQEWTMTAAPSITPAPLAKGAFRSPRRVQGSWYKYVVDLSAYADQEGYVAIRHFSCSDWFYLVIDDVTIDDVAPEPEPEDPTGEGCYKYTFRQAMNGWTSIDADGDGNDWYLLQSKSILSHDGLPGMMTSASYASVALTPDNYLVSPKIKLDGKLIFYAQAQDASYAKEHFSVVASTAGNTDAADFTTVLMEETEMKPAPRRAQGSWYRYEVDLSSLAGAEGYVAIRHFNCTDWFRLNVDDITLVTSQMLGEYDPELEKEPEDPRVIPPTELITQDWTFAGYFYDRQSDSPTEKTLKVGAVGTDVYVQGISFYQPEAWIKGTLGEDGKSITFASGQYYGAYQEQYDMWFAAVDAEFNYLESVTVAYDAENGVITWPEDAYIIENGDASEAYAYGYYYEIVAIIKGSAPAANEVPTGLEFAEWSLKSQALVQDEETGEQDLEEYDYRISVAVAGNDVYVAGYFEDLPDAVLKGTLDPETKKVTFPTGQCMGVTYDIDWSTWTLIEVPVFFAGYGVDGFENAVMTYDAEAQTLTQESPIFFLVNGSWLLLNPYLVQTEVTMKAIPDVAAVPAQPEIVKSSFSGYYPSVSVDIPVEAADGSDILTDKLYYQYWTEINGVQAPLTLDPSEYTELTEPMTVIPYSFTDDWDIYNYRLYLNQDFSTWKKIGIQSIYRGGEAENKSEISWKTIANLSVDPEFDSSKGGIAIQTKALEGEKAEIAVYPDNGYKVAKVTARVGKTYIKVDEEEDEDGNIVYSVIVPPADVIVNAEFDVTPADFTVNVVPGDLTAQIDAATEGMIVRSLNIQMEAGEYTITKPIIAAGDLNINGNGAVIDASGIVAGEDGSETAPFIQMSTEPQVDFAKKQDGTDTDYYKVTQVAVRDAHVKGLKNSIFWDANTKYLVEELRFENCQFDLATEAVQNEALISFQAGGAKDVSFFNNTFAGNNAVAKYFIRYNNAARLDRYGYNTSVDYMNMTYTNNTFYGLLIADGQWGNYSAISGQKYVSFNVQNNIWFNSSKQIIRRMAGGRINDEAPVNFVNNTYFYEGVDESAGEVNYDKSGTILTSDPKFEDAANGDFSVRNKTEQALNQTGDWNRWGEWIVDVYDIIIEVPFDAPGTVKAPANAQEGELITLEVVPAEGYRLVEGSLKVFIGKSEIELVDNSFSMPAANVKVTAEFELIPVYAINIAEGIENGTVTADKQEAAEGDVVTLTVVPAEGYELDYITVTGVNSDITVPVENNKFTMPADAVTINAAFKSTATGIQTISVDELENATIYTLQGVRVEKAQKGIFIVNGKKTVIK